MCPSYMVTRRRAALHPRPGPAAVRDARAARPITDGWRSPTTVAEALDLCLACKGCKSDCPVNVDMATYKAEFLSHHYAGRVRPRSHYSLGWLPLWARLAAPAPGRPTPSPTPRSCARVAKSLAGVDQQRDVPRFARASVHALVPAPAARSAGGAAGPVLLWPDTFTNYLSPHGIAAAAVGVLEAAGFRVEMPGDRPSAAG